MQTAIPRYRLYGEPAEPAEGDFVHHETIRARAFGHGWKIEPHRHGDLRQILLILGGGGLLACDDRLIRFDAPCVILLPPTIVHGFTFDPGTEGHVLTLAEVFVRDLAGVKLTAEIDGLLKEAAVLSAPAPAPLHEILQKLADELTDARSARTLAIAGQVLSLWAEIARLAPQASLAGTGEERLYRTFQALVQEHYRQNIAIGFYAARLKISESRLTALCRRVSGASPLDLIQRQRLEEAKRQLLYTDNSIADVGASVGFEDPAYFSRFFQKQAGRAPGLWRREVRADA